MRQLRRPGNGNERGGIFIDKAHLEAHICESGYEFFRTCSRAAQARQVEFDKESQVLVVRYCRAHPLQYPAFMPFNIHLNHIGCFTRQEAIDSDGFDRDSILDLQTGRGRQAIAIRALGQKEIYGSAGITDRFLNGQNVFESRFLDIFLKNSEVGWVWLESEYPSRGACLTRGNQRVHSDVRPNV